MDVRVWMGEGNGEGWGLSEAEGEEGGGKKVGRRSIVISRFGADIALVKKTTFCK